MRSTLLLIGSVTLLALMGCDNPTPSGTMAASAAPTMQLEADTDATGVVHGPGPYGGTSRPATGTTGKSKPERMKALMAWIRGAYVDGAPSGPMPKADDTFTQLGDRLYADLCASCHGDEGDGLGPLALKPPPPPPDSLSLIHI